MSAESRQFGVHPESETTRQSSAYSVNKPEGHLTLDMSDWSLGQRLLWPTVWRTQIKERREEGTMFGKGRHKTETQNAKMLKYLKDISSLLCLNVQ